MNIRLGIFIFLFGVVAAAFFPVRAFGEERVHIVRKGETFYSIAQSLGLRADDLMRYNGITDPARLQAGQTLKIPVPQSATVPAGTGSGTYTSYRVVRGDTFYSIARKYSVTESQIRQANGLAANYMLREGDSLKIPGNVIPGNEIPVSSAPVATPVIPVVTPNTAGENPQVNWPITAKELSYMTGKLSGVVITGTRAEPVKSLTWGTVLSAGPYRGFGNVAIIQVEGGYLYVYGGCESLSVKEGDKVGPGTELGRLGIDVVSAKPQLFFMVYRSNTPIDPAKAPRAL